MALNSHEISRLARILDDGLLGARELPRITEEHSDLSLEDAYRIQDEGIALRVSRGEKIIGYKMGLTSKAKQEQMNLRLPIYGVLTDRMRVAGGKFPLKGTIHPKIEPEIAFLISRDLSGKLSREEALQSISAVFAAMEILDSRFVGFKYFSLPDVVADNCSSSYFVSGEPVREFHSLNLSDLDMIMSINGKTVQSAKSNAILGDPVLSLIALSEMLGARGLKLAAGSIVLAGAATVAVQLETGMDVALQVTGLPEVKVSVASASH